MAEPLKLAVARCRPPHVALVVQTSMAYGRRILEGVSRYARENGPWTFYFEPRSRQDPLPAWLASWDGDGIILGVSKARREVRPARRVPTVDLDDQGGRPHVQSDHRAIGALAAEHLLERGFKRFAFFGYPGFRWSVGNYDGFAERVRREGWECRLYRGGQQASWGHQLPAWDQEMETASRWVASLPKPLGLMACNDFRGIQALEACRRAGVSVPEEVAVVGADDETLACELADPPLSSVIPDCRSIGYQAASLLDRMMRGERPPRTTLMIPPLGVAVRQSTEITAIEEPCVAEALRYIRDNACLGIRVDDVLEHVAVSRSKLQRRFREAIGRTIHETIARERLRRVEQLLAETDLSYEAVAARSGFAYLGYMSTVFRQATGVTPAAYRQQHARDRGFDPSA
ncbi:AraC family transcriptional regulator [Paludisphaera mucosa]|uniref:DNA-binding transcriptional regulator n=1 Tax=Paludisphaera mucosa TaxID=3030827 RepID=A0ABT6FCM6_9BACT|nr:DNA-binding transcriptional regulator [Paludisphaera mucosa]MDG3005343.1 DNA-binding transcriptional regulator [Paludisphaera mucosa]